MSSTTQPADRLADLLAAARGLEPALIEIRRRFHRIPEVGLELPATQAALVEEVERLGLTVTRGTSVGSVVAVIEGELPGPTVLLRADMDALPVPEDTGLDFASERAGFMHACGHDTHMAMLLGGARLLLERRAELRGRVVLMFQPGEEGWHGARYMLDEGLLAVAEPPPTGAFALHISTSEAIGIITGRGGAMLASADALTFRVHGRGGHASAPHEAIDPVPVAAELILALQAMVTRTVDVFDPAVVTVAHIEAGFANNIIPETVFMEGTLRTVSEERRASTKDRIRQVAAGVAAAHGATIEVEIVPGYPVTLNDPAFAAWALGVARDVLGDASVEEVPAPIMGAEDFSYVLQQVPGAMFFIGARPAGVAREDAQANHSNKVVFDESAMAAGAALYAAIALAHADR